MNIKKTILFIFVLSLIQTANSMSFISNQVKGLRNSMMLFERKDLTSFAKRFFVSKLIKNLIPFSNDEFDENIGPSLARFLLACSYEVTQGPNVSEIMNSTKQLTKLELQQKDRLFLNEALITASGYAAGFGSDDDYQKHFLSYLALSVLFTKDEANKSN
jgi:hypothetical protein